MTLTLAPDAEKVLHSYLANIEEIMAMDARVTGETKPKDPDSAPWVRITQLDGPSNLHPQHLVGFYLQIDCYASKAGVGGSQQKEVANLAGYVRSALGVMKEATHDGAVVTGAAINGDARDPDEEFEPARQRRIITTTIWMHG